MTATNVNRAYRPTLRAPRTTSVAPVSVAPDLVAIVHSLVEAAELHEGEDEQHEEQQDCRSLLQADVVLDQRRLSIDQVRHRLGRPLRVWSALREQRHL